MPTLTLILFFFLIGTVLASFLCNVVYRMQRGQDFLRGRSHCETCHHPLGFPELVPVLGYLVTLGRCRYCRQRIPLRYPLTEFISGSLFALAGSRLLTASTAQSNPWPTLLTAIFLVWVLGLWLLITLYDMETMLILDKVIFPAIVITLFLQLIRAPGAWREMLLSAAMCGGIVGLIVLITRDRGMGRGDIKLALLIGLAVGWPYGLIALLAAFVIGALFGIALILTRGKSLKTAIPFGPFLCLGGYLALLYGPGIWNWYSQYLLL